MRPMRRQVVYIAGACMFVTAIGAQTTPDFSGSWIRDEARTTSTTTAGAQASLGTAVPIGVTVIRQTPTELTVLNEGMGMPITHVFKLDGSDSVNHNGAMTQTTRSHWNGGQLVTEGKDTQTTSQGYAEWKIKATRFLDAKGNLIVDTTQTDLQGIVTTSHQVFTKKKGTEPFSTDPG